VSIGVSLYPDHGASPAELVRAADQALYRAKRAGRDRAFLFAPGTEISA
jgi:diguanylate cyclase (GGDEF)-like protein